MRIPRPGWRGLAVLLVAGMSISYAAEDLIIADFEGKDYGEWTVKGEAFGPGPASGTLKGQMKVAGFLGKGLVNSYHGGDGSTGSLTSPPFTIERPYINFLIGGGKYPEKTCMNLLIKDKAVRSALGYNNRAGGSESLHWQDWDVKAFIGQEAVIEIIDQRKGGWGHINVDHIMQSNQKYIEEKTLEIDVKQRYLNLPVTKGAPKTWVHVYQGEELVREFDIELASTEPDYWVVLEIDEFAGKTLRLDFDEVSRDSLALEKIHQADVITGAENLYREEFRPQFHFSPMRGWNNDPNGMVYYDGEYHLFFQHNPFGWNWGNMTWGHAVSKDLVHWEELGDAIHPDELGTIYSGSAVVDWKNTTGFQTGDEPPLVAIYTSSGGNNPASKGQPHTQSLAYSNDKGRTWTVYENNPVQGHIEGSNRDPKVIWYEPNNEWVIVLFLENKELAFFTSKDLITWELQSRLPNFHECPELFELPVDGDTSNMKWVVYGADGSYYIGEFDGKTFTPESEVLPFQYGNCFYASQTFSDIPAEDGRRIQIAWGRIGHEAMPFNQMMDFPVELSLHTTEKGIRMFANPVQEIELLHKKVHQVDGASLEGITSDLLHINAEITVGKADEIAFIVRGVPVTYDVKKETLTCLDKVASLSLQNGQLRLELLVDRMSIEIFGNEGQVYMPMGMHFNKDAAALSFATKGGEASVNSMTVAELNSAWK